jgi:hypothetical protein
MTCKCGREMNETGPAYYLSNNYYQKYLCLGCNKTKVKVLNGYSKGGRIKV